MLMLLWMLTACDAEQPPPTPSATPTTQPAPPPAANSVDTASSAVVEPVVLDLDEPPTRITARHIVVSYKDATRSSSQRSRLEAQERAQQLLAQLRAAPEQFEQLAVSASDGPSAIMGGHLGSFALGTMDQAFEDAAFRLAIGEISDVVETPFGFHIIERMPSTEICVSHVLVQWQEVARSAATRSAEEARAIMEQAQQRIASGESPAAVARELSDGPNALRGGDLGCFQKGQLVPAFDDVAFQLEPGEVSGIVESPMGYHIIVRHPDP